MWAFWAVGLDVDTGFLCSPCVGERLALEQSQAPVCPTWAGDLPAVSATVPFGGYQVSDNVCPAHCGHFTLYSAFLLAHRFYLLMYKR